MTKPFRALLLAAGAGTRLRPLTNHTPKCLVPIGGEPLLNRWLNHLESIKCERTLINTHHLATQVNTFLDNRQRTTMTVERTYEPKLLGTAGTLMNNLDFFEKKTGLLIHADNATNVDLAEFIKAHRNRPEGCLLTMMTFNTDSPSKCGIVQVNKEGVVEGFYEKVTDPPGNTANGAIYAFDNEFLTFLNEMEVTPTDFSNQVLPGLCRQIYTWHTDDVYIDVGTPDNLMKAQSMLSVTQKPET